MKRFQFLAFSIAAFTSAAVWLAGCEGSSKDDDSSSTTTTTVTNTTAATVTGSWSGHWTRSSDAATGTFDLALSQSDTTLTGSYTDGTWYGNIAGSINTSTRKLSFQITFTYPAGRAESWSGTLADASLNAVSGTWSCSNDGNSGTWTAEKD